MSLGMLANVTQWWERDVATQQRGNITYIQHLPLFFMSLSALLMHSRALLSYILQAGGWWAVWGGRSGRGDRRGEGGGLTLVSLSSSSVSSLFWAARPSWSSLTIRMMWFQLNSLIRSNQTWAWWEYGGTVRRKDRWMLWTEDQQLKCDTRVHINDLWLLEATLSVNNLDK